MLTRYEAEVLCAASAAEALEILKSQTPDLIVSDIGMPEKDGYQLIREVRNLGAARGGNIPAIALTAFARPEDRMKAMIAGYQTHLPKPVEAHELIATIRTLTRWMHKPVNSGNKHNSRNKHDQQLIANSGLDGSGCARNRVIAGLRRCLILRGLITDKQAARRPV